MWVSSLNHITKKYKIYLQLPPSYNNNLGGGLQTSGLFLLSVPNYQLMLPLWEWLYMLQLPGFGPNNLSVASTLYSTNQFSGDQQNSNGSGGIGFYDFQQQLQYNTFLDLYNTASFNAHKIDAINAANDFNPTGLVSDTFRSMYYGKDGKQNKNVFSNLSTLRLNKKDAEKTLNDANNQLENAQEGDDLEALGKAQSDALQAVADADKELKLGRAAAAGAGLNMAGDVLKAVLPDRPEYDSPNGLLTQTLDLAYDKIASAVSSFGPWGLLVGGIMKAGAGVGKLMGNIGGGTDGMCVCAGTRVVTASGKFINIEDLCQKDGIVGWGDGLTRILKIDVLLNPSQKQCVEIELDNGLTLRCSFDHPVLWSKNGRGTSVYLPDKSRQRIRNWEFKPAIEIEPGDYLGVTNDINIWGSKEMWEPYLVGLLIGDGYYRRSSVRLGTGDPETWSYIELHLVGKRTNYNDSYYSKEYREYVITNGRIHLEELGIHGQAKLEKRLPKNIHEYSKDSVCKLIAGLFDSDGSIFCNKDGSDCKIVFYLANIELIKQLKEQLLKLGIHSYLHYFKAASSIINSREVFSKEHFALCIRDKLSLLKFCEQIPLNISYKKENLAKIQIFKSEKIVRGDRNRTGARAYRIKKVTPIGILVVYNLQTSKDHTYLANGIITHNTKTDAIMGSSFMNLTPWGLVNGFGGKKADTFTKDNDAFALVGSSYTGTNAQADKALERSGKKYGLFSSHQRGTANRQIAEAKRQLNVVSNISDTALKRNNLRGSMSAIRSNQRAVRRQGGYKQDAMRSGRVGLRISPAMAGRIARVPILLLLGGGIHYQDQDYIDRLVQYAIDQNPLFIQRLLSIPTLYVITFNGQPGTHLLAFSDDDNDGYLIVYPMIQGRDGELVFISDPREALSRALLSGDYIKFNSVDDADLFTKHYKEYFPEFMEAFYKLVAPYVDEEGRIDQEKVKNTKKEKEATKHKLGGALQLGLAILLVSPFGEEVQTYKDGGSLTNLRIIQLVNPIPENIESMQEGGEVTDMADLQLTLIELIDPTLGGDDIVPEEQEGIPLPAPISPDVPTMRDGGEINIIPDGALHKELHHMEDPEGEWTRKGIPVVDAEGNLVAEIEKAEVILRKDLIETIEEYTKKYYDKDTTKEEKELLALDCGILLVNEILYNTEDKTNKLL